MKGRSNTRLRLPLLTWRIVLAVVLAVGVGFPNAWALADEEGSSTSQGSSEPGQRAESADGSRRREQQSGDKTFSVPGHLSGSVCFAEEHGSSVRAASICRS